MKKGAAYLLVGIFGLAAIFWLAYLCFYRFERHLLAYYAWFVVGGGVAVGIRKAGRKKTTRIVYRYFFISVVVIFLQSVIAAIANNEKILKFLLHDFLVFLPWYTGWYLVLSRNDLEKENIFFIVSLHSFLFEELYLQPPLLLPLILPLVIAFYWLMFYPVFLLFPPAPSPAPAAPRVVPFSRAFFLPLVFALLGQVFSDTLAAHYPRLFSPHNM